jgi:hypothetical protein
MQSQLIDLIANAIDRMTLQMRSFIRHARVIKITPWITDHADALHDSCRPLVVVNGEGNDFREAEGVESIVDQSFARLGYVTLAPIGRGQPPADFNNAVR